MTTDKIDEHRVTEILARMPKAAQARTSPENIGDVLRALATTDKSRADALTDERILCMWRFDHELPRDASILSFARTLLAASPVEQHEAANAPRFKRYDWNGKESDTGALVYYLDVLEAISLVEGEQQEAAPADSRYTHPGCEVCGCPTGVCQAERASDTQPKPPVADERKAIGEVRFELETIRDGALHWSKNPGGWSGTTAACNRALDALARASSPNAATLNATPSNTRSTYEYRDTGALESGDAE